jgi:plastocyanin
MKSIKKISVYLSCLIVVTLLTGGFCKNALGQGAEEAKKIRPELKTHGSKIISITGDMRSPLTTEVAPGTTVVWVNGTASNLVFKFTGKQVTMACAAPVNFFVDDEGSFSSNVILQYATASLCFVEKGSYDYKIRFRSSGIGSSGGSLKEVSGTVVVK